MQASMKRGNVTEEQHRDEKGRPLLKSRSSNGDRSADHMRRAEPGDVAKITRTQNIAKKPRTQTRPTAKCRFFHVQVSDEANSEPYTRARNIPPHLETHSKMPGLSWCAERSHVSTGRTRLRLRRDARRNPRKTTARAGPIGGGRCSAASGPSQGGRREAGGRQCAQAARAKPWQSADRGGSGPATRARAGRRGARAGGERRPR